MRLRQFIPPAFTASLIFACFLTAFTPLGKYLLWGISGIYLAANLLASTSVAMRKGWRYLPILPVIFFALHMSYGLGFLIGLFRFANRWGEKSNPMLFTKQAQN